RRAGPPAPPRRPAAPIPARLRPPHGPAARIGAAGSPGGLGPPELMAIKALAALLATPIGTLFAQAAPGRLGILLTLAAPVAGFFAPDWWLARRTRRRLREARRDLPTLLDLMPRAVDPGLAPS